MSKAEKENKNSAGRDTVMTPEIIAKLETCFGNGLTDEQACFFVGIGTSTLYDYCKLNPDFRSKKEGLKNRVDIKAKMVVVGSIKEGDVKSSKWWLEKKCRDEFASRNENDNKIIDELGLFDDDRMAQIKNLADKK